MKPLHIGLLVVGAALAGGLAVKMTQPTVLPNTVPIARVLAPPKAAAPVVAPAAVDAPKAAETANPTGTGTPAAKADTAPPTVYEEPKAAAKPSPIRWKAAKEASAKETATKQALVKPAAKPVTIAKNDTSSVAPPPYQGSGSGTAPPNTYPVVEPPATATSPVELPRTPDPQPEPEPPAPIAPRKVTLATGSTIPARLMQTLSSDKLRAGDTFQATLAEPLIVGDLVIAERGSRVSGKVVDASMAGKFQGSSKLELALTSFESADGQRVAVSTTPWVKQGENGKNGEIAKIGGGAALGAIIGAIAGGGKGAAIGAGVGGGAGTGAVAMSPPKPVSVPTETVIRFRLASSVTITERM